MKRMEGQQGNFTSMPYSEEGYTLNSCYRRKVGLFSGLTFEFFKHFAEHCFDEEQLCMIYRVSE